MMVKKHNSQWFPTDFNLYLQQTVSVQKNKHTGMQNRNTEDLKQAQIMEHAISPIALQQNAICNHPNNAAPEWNMQWAQ